MALPAHQLNVAIACGGTGGHLFPGLAVAAELARRGARVTLMISPKEIDQLAVKGAEGFDIVTLPAVGLAGGRVWPFCLGFQRSYRLAKSAFRPRPPHAVLAMGGFTSAPPVLAGRRYKAPAFLHESNSIPGRANRWLSWLVERAFVGFPGAAARLHTRKCSVTGTPVRPKFQPCDPGPCRVRLGLEPARPVALVMGGSQGAHGINELVLRSLPLLAQRAPDWQWVHLAGPTDAEALRERYAAVGLKAAVHPFYAEMDRAMGAATACVSRAGASSLAELAAMRLPALLVPFPAATDNHQFHNAQAYESTGAALLLPQRSADPEVLSKRLGQLMCDEPLRQRMRAALADWDRPHAAGEIAQAILDAVRNRTDSRRSSTARDEEGSADRAGACLAAAGDWRASRIFRRPGLGKGGAA
jgi:UDP-N-acetylglucosamine--N-acetylmuramyl-(pentapeptide) pyrophosphoryl-undecaprenol N-acetylglucosamine transferase